MDRLAGGRSQRPGGGRRARTARTKHGRGPLAPAHALVLRAPWARKTPPPPGVTQLLPPPLRQRASASHTAVGCGHRKEGADMRGAAAFGGRGPMGPRPATNQSRGPWPRLYGRSAPPPPPLGRSASSLPRPTGDVPIRERLTILLEGFPASRCLRNSAGQKRFVHRYPSGPLGFLPRGPSSPWGISGDGGAAAFGGRGPMGPRPAKPKPGPKAPALWALRAPAAPPRAQRFQPPPSKPGPPPLGTLRVPRGLFQAEQAALLLVHGG